MAELSMQEFARLYILKKYLLSDQLGKYFPTADLQFMMWEKEKEEGRKERRKERKKEGLWVWKFDKIA